DEPAWIEAARFFWETVAQRRSIAFGGNSVREHFNPVDDFGTMLASREGPETCNSYNMLRLTRLLHRLDPQPRYADFYERTLYNHILSTQHPEHGGLVYFTPLRPRRSEEHTSELHSRDTLVCRLLLETKKCGSDWR